MRIAEALNLIYRGQIFFHDINYDQMAFEYPCIAFLCQSKITFTSIVSDLNKHMVDKCF